MWTSKRVYDPPKKVIDEIIALQAQREFEQAIEKTNSVIKEYPKSALLMALRVMHMLTLEIQLKR